jgi:oligopeptide/dipeptide ABC transporter ATP-binding protein
MAERPRETIVEARGVRREYPLRRGIVRILRRQPRETLRAVDDVSLRIVRGETLGLVGESGCGKSTFGRLLLQLEKPTGGEIIYDGLLAGSKGGIRRKVQIIFQDPYSSLNPRKTVRSTLEEVLSVHNLCPRAERTQRVDELLSRVGLSAELGDRRPHQLSGGQRQRAMIALALACRPALVIADEPTTALDVSVQAQVLNLLVKLQEELHLTYLFISHNLGVVRHVSQRVAVMYLGRIVEEAPTGELFERPLHPYTQALLEAVPSLDPDVVTETVAVEGDLPNAIDPPSGCHFHPRCPAVMDVCRREYPALRTVSAGRVVACHLYEGEPLTPLTD